MDRYVESVASAVAPIIDELMEETNSTEDDVLWAVKTAFDNLECDIHNKFRLVEMGLESNFDRWEAESNYYANEADRTYEERNYKW